MHLAAENGHVNVIDLLVNFPKTDINAKDVILILLFVLIREFFIISVD